MECNKRSALKSSGLSISQILPKNKVKLERILKEACRFRRTIKEIRKLRFGTTCRHYGTTGEGSRQRYASEERTKYRAHSYSYHLLCRVRLSTICYQEITKEIKESCKKNTQKYIIIDRTQDIYLQNAFAMATCSRIAIIGTITRPIPKSFIMVLNVTNSYPGFGSDELEIEEFDMGRSKLNGGRWNDGIPDLISPVLYNTAQHLVPMLRVRNEPYGVIIYYC